MSIKQLLRRLSLFINTEKIEIPAHVILRAEYFLELKHFYLMKFEKYADELYLNKAKECELLYTKYKNSLFI